MRPSERPVNPCRNGTKPSWPGGMRLTPGYPLRFSFGLTSQADLFSGGDDGELVIHAVEQAEQGRDQAGIALVLHRVELAGGDDADQLRLGQRGGQARLGPSV